VTAFQNARDLFAQIGDRRHEANAWWCLGGTLLGMGRCEDAIASYQHDLAYRQETGDSEREAEAWFGIFGALHKLGRLDEAKDALEKVLTAATEAESDHWQGVARRMLDLIREQTGGTSEKT
jgi:tetratricopeptide (TPR) repeat protein